MLTSIQLATLKEHAKEAAQRAYAPYSRFAVGAAVLTDAGVVFVAANVENASYGLSMCAERNAIFQAVASGARDLRALLVYTSGAMPATPCGACRQVMHEFGPHAAVVCCNDDDRADRHYTVAQLLPDAFGSDALA